MDISIDPQPHPMMTRQRARDQLGKPRKAYTQFDVQSSDILTEPMDDIEEEQFHDTSPEPLLLPDGELESFFDPTKPKTDDSSSRPTSLPAGQQNIELNGPPPELIVDFELSDPKPCD